MIFKMPKRDKAVTIIDHDAKAPPAMPWWGVAYSLAVWCMLAACIILPITKAVRGLLSP